jgi:hypothetical protein
VHDDIRVRPPRSRPAGLLLEHDLDGLDPVDLALEQDLRDDRDVAFLAELELPFAVASMAPPPIRGAFTATPASGAPDSSTTVPSRRPSPRICPDRPVAATVQKRKAVRTLHR